jgi:glycosyltransferase involved in cell wall biosynthesis
MNDFEGHLTNGDEKEGRKPEVSVIIPTLNEEQYIKITLMAVKNQKTNFSYEPIVVDGQSSDNTVRIAENYAKVYISDKKGKVPQLNYAAKKASGDLFLFLDADTILVDPLFLQKTYKKFQKNRDLFALSARFKYFDGHSLSFRFGPYRFVITKYFFINLFSHLYYFFKDLFGYTELTGMNLMVRRNIFNKVNGFKNPPNSLGIDKTFSDSLLYLIKILKKGKIKTLNYLSVLTSARNLTVERSFKRIRLYFSEKETYRKLAKESIEI